MSEEMKLITALCEALGFNVEVSRNYDERKEENTAVVMYNSFIDYPHTRNRTLKSTGGIFDLDDNGKYASQLIKPILSYKLTKRNN